MNEIYVEIDGGVLVRVCSNIKNAKVIVLDWDSYKAEDDMGRIAMDELNIELKEKLEKNLIKQIY